MVADDVAVGEGGVCKSDNIRFIINVLPGTVFTRDSDAEMPQDFGYTSEIILFQQNVFRSDDINNIDDDNDDIRFSIGDKPRI